MKIGGTVLQQERYKDFVVFPRGDENQIVIWAVALDDEWDFFNDTYPEPKPPVIFKPREGNVENFDDKGYQQQRDNFLQMKLDYCVIHSITGETDIEWDTVELENPHTWSNWRADMRKNGFTLPEVNKVFTLCLDVNTLSEGLLERAKEAFLSSQRKEQSDK